MTTKKTVGDEPQVEEKAPVISDAERNAQAIADKWVDECLRNSVFSRNTEAWNHLVESLPKLVEGIVNGGNTK